MSTIKRIKALMLGTDRWLAALEDDVAELERERQTFYMNYRMKCDEETKALQMLLDAAHEQIAKLEQAQFILGMRAAAELVRPGRARLAIIAAANKLEKYREKN